MSVKKEASGRRSVQVEVEVPGTPEEVWAAIATGPGISSWFVPTQVDGRVGGKIACDFGGGMVSSSEIREWQPPHRLVAEDTWMPGAPPVATEWTVQAKAGGNCVVRVVHSLFASTADWDDQLESTENGWPSFFRVLRYYLSQHRGQRSAIMQAMAMGSGAPDQMWSTLTRALGAPSPRIGQRLRIQTAGAAALSGTVEHVDSSSHGNGLQVRLTEPVPGILLTGAFACNGMPMATLQAYLYGDGAAAAARDQARWQDWLSQLFPSQATEAAPQA